VPTSPPVPQGTTSTPTGAAGTPSPPAKKKQTWHARDSKKHPSFKDWPVALKAKEQAEAKAKKAIQEPFEEIPSPSYDRKENLPSQEAPKLQTLHKALSDWTTSANERKARRLTRFATARLEQLSKLLRPSQEYMGSPETDRQFGDRLNYHLRNFEKTL
jgi:hypothetical protein